MARMRDLGSPIWALDRLTSVDNDGPGASSVVWSGPILTVPDGHYGTRSGIGEGVDEDTLEDFIEDLSLRGAGVVKVAMVSARGLDCIPSKLAKHIVEVASRYKLPVAAHAHLQTDMVESALNAGVTTIEHGFVLHRKPDLLARMAEEGVALTPTLAVVESIRKAPNMFGQRLIPAAWGMH